MKRQAIERLLPAVFQRAVRPNGPLRALLDVMEILHAPSEEALQNLHHYFDPRRAPDDFVPFLAHWVDLDRLYREHDVRVGSQALAETLGTGRLRELVASAAYLSRWRGTSRGLRLFLEVATGVSGFGIEEGADVPPAEARPYHIKIRVPAAAAEYRKVIERIVELEKPAYVTHEIEIEGG